MKALSLYRMKNTVTYLFIVFLASLIFYGGAGVNFVTYCCNDCRTEGVAVLLNDNCCEVHGHGCCDTPAEEETSCSSGCCEDDYCDLERISFDWSSANNPIVELQPVVIDLLSFSSSLALLVPVPSIKEYISQDQGGPPIVCPRIYLNLLTTLLI